MKELIRHILKEETIDLSQNLMRLFDKTLVKENSGELCSISVKQIGKSYSVSLFFKIGVFTSVRERLMNDAWNMVYDVTGRSSSIHQKDCEKKDNIQEETSAQSKLLGVIKRFGIDYGAKAVGGFDRLNKIMEGTDFLYVKIDAGPDEVRKYLDGDKNWGRKTFYGAILRDPYNFHSWGEYDVDNLMDDIDEENLTNIRLILSEETGEDLTTTSIDELLEYDTFGHITEAINNAANNIDSDAYSDYLYNQLKKAFEEYGGEVFSMDDTGVTFTVNLGKYLKDLTDEEYGYYRDVCQDNYVCMFNEMVYDDGGTIDRPRPYFSDNWYNNNFDNDQFNELISDNLQEYLN